MYWPSAQFMVFLWNKIDVSGSWITGLRCKRLSNVIENYVTGSLQWLWRHSVVLTLEGKGLMIVFCSVYWSAWEDITGNMASLSQKIRCRLLKATWVTLGEDAELTYFMVLSKQARQDKML